MASIAPVYGFGDYTLPLGRNFSQMQLCAKVQKIALAILFGLLTLVAATLPFALVTVPALAYATFRLTLTAAGAFYRAPPVQNLFPAAVNQNVTPLNTPGPCSGFATHDGIQSHAWKLHLIRSARHSIVLSGNYCGGASFAETLQLIQAQMRTHPALTASILASNLFVTPENTRQIEEITQEFGSRFTCVITPEVFPFLSPTTDTASISANHTKALVIDYGAAFMTGGSGILSPWAAQAGTTPPRSLESHGLVYDHLMQVRAYRDMDFVFHSPEPNGIGTRLHMEMIKLTEKFRYRETPPPPTSWPDRLDPLPALGTPLRAALYATGPDTPSSAFLDEIIAQVQNARESILIGHMYFHPPKKLLEALIAASNRGVQITLITNKLGRQSPGLHLTYAELSRYHAKLLFEGKAKPNVEHYEYNIPYTTFHKKVILIDGRTTFLGSANIGKKSLESLDYEIDLKVESEEFGRSIAAILAEDKRYCEKDTDPTLSLKTRALSTFQSLFIPVL